MSMRSIVAAALIAALSCLTTDPASAADAPARLGLCASCHGETGHATSAGTPHLAGQDLTYLRNAIAAYRSGERDVAVMRAAVGALSAADLDELAAWYASRPMQRPTP
jgi:cytochrome c553